MTTNSTAANAIGRSSAPNRNIGWFEALTDAYRRRQERSLIRFELQQMTTRELADLGLSPADINDVARGTYRRDD